MTDTLGAVRRWRRTVSVLLARTTTRAGRTSREWPMGRLREEMVFMRQATPVWRHLHLLPRAVSHLGAPLLTGAFRGETSAALAIGRASARGRGWLVGEDQLLGEARRGSLPTT